MQVASVGTWRHKLTCPQGVSPSRESQAPEGTGAVALSDHRVAVWTCTKLEAPGGPGAALCRLGVGAEGWRIPP